MLSALWAEPRPQPSKRQKKGGGWRQQLEAIPEDTAPVFSKMGTGLLKEWADGQLSSVKVQYHAANGKSDGLRNPMVDRLAALPPGKHAQSGLIAMLEGVGLKSLQTKVAEYTGENVTHITLPSTMIRYLFEHHRKAFGTILGADSNKLRAFWTDFLRRPLSKQWADQHPFLKEKTPGDLVTTVPITLHTDAGPCAKNTSANCVSWSGLLSAGEEKLTKLLAFSHIKKQEHKFDTPAWQKLLDDFDALATGIVDGTPVAKEGRKTWRFVIMVCKSDEEVRCNEFGLPHWGSSEPCGDCWANRTNREYTDLQESARWRRTEDMPFEAWFERIRRPHHPLVASHYCCARWVFYIDLMHLADCKGTSASVFGGVLELLVRMETLGATRQQRLDQVKAYMTSWYEEHPGTYRLPDIRLSNLRQDDGWSELHGQTVKAANTRASAPMFVDMVKHFFTEDSEEHRSVIAICNHVNKVYEIMYASSMFMTAAETAALRTSVLQVGVHWLVLRESCRTAGILAFKVSPKAHRFQHLPLWSQVLNPRFVQCYSEESLIGTTTTIWAKTMNGPYHKTVQELVLLKRTCGFLCRLEA